MGAATEVLLVNNSTSNAFSFRCVKPFRDKTSQNVIPFPLVNTTPANTVLFRFSGKEQDISFTFAIFNDDTDVANGSYTSLVKTVKEQIEYLRDVVFGEDFDVDWTLTQDTFAASGIVGVITNLEFDPPGPAGVIVTGSFTFKRGRIGDL